MYRDDSTLEAQIADLLRRIRVLETQAPVGFTSVSRGALRILSTEGLIVVGTSRIDGTQYVDGRLEGSGVFDWSGAMWLRGSVMLPGNLTGVGTMLWSGPWELRGNGDVTGNVDLTGDFIVASGGKIVAGPVTIDRGGSYGGRVYSSGTLLLDAGADVVLGSAAQVLGDLGVFGDIAATGNISAIGDVTGQNKYFVIDHPSQAGKQLRHGSLEGPEHGVYYRGIVEFDASGEAVFELPDYFVALVLPDDEPTVQVTAQGRPFMTGYEPVADGRVTIYGEPDRRASVHVTAARGRFEVEPDAAED